MLLLLRAEKVAPSQRVLKLEEAFHRHSILKKLSTNCQVLQQLIHSDQVKQEHVAVHDDGDDHDYSKRRKEKKNLIMTKIVEL